VPNVLTKILNNSRHPRRFFIMYLVFPDVSLRLQEIGQLFIARYVDEENKQTDVAEKIVAQRYALYRAIISWQNSRRA